MLTPAKVNLYLTVGPTRPQDGRHEIRTVFLPLPRIADEVTITPGEPGTGIRLTCEGLNIDGNPDDNLVCRAIRSYVDTTGCSGDWQVRLVKRIPVSAGLGGGSSDAAAAFLEMERLNGCQVDLPALAVQLGADVPFFLNPRPSMATGIGEILTLLEACPEYDAVVVSPGFPSPVAWAYQHWMRPKDAVPPPWPPPKFDDLATMTAYAWNDLGFALCRKFPVMNIALEALLAAGADAAIVAGSGACLLGFCPPNRTDEIRNATAKRLANYTTLQVL